MPLGPGYYTQKKYLTLKALPFLSALVAVVEVDSETGAVHLSRLVACDDAGVILNPLLADGQVHGGLAQGIRL